MEVNCATNLLVVEFPQLSVEVMMFSKILSLMVILWTLAGNGLLIVGNLPQMLTANQRDMEEL
jgi:hypothetical protein